MYICININICIYWYMFIVICYFTCLFLIAPIKFIWILYWQYVNNCLIWQLVDIWRNSMLSMPRHGKDSPHVSIPIRLVQVLIDALLGEMVRRGLTHRVVAGGDNVLNVWTICPLEHKKRQLSWYWFAVIGGSGGCRYDNLRCYQWWQNWYHGKSLLSI